MLMAFVLALSLLPTAAFAAGGGDPQGSGTKDDPYVITTADQLAGIKKNLGAYYKLGDNITLTGNWQPIGTFEAANEDGETPKAEEAFTGVFDGNGKTISGLKVNGSIAAGLFGCVANGTVKNVTIQNATVSGSCMAAAAVGYAYNSTVENVKLTATESQQSTITANILNYQGTDMAPNMVAGIVGAGMDSTIKNCTVENTKMTVTGLTQAAGWGTNVHDMGLLGGGLEGTSLEGCTVKNSELSVTGAYSFGIGGLSGCAMGADHVKDCTVNNVKITLGDNAYLTGGLVGYAGKTDGEVTELSGCKSENVQITAGASSSRIGGLIGGGFYLPAYRSYFPVPTSYSVTGSEVTNAAITTGANSAALGLVAGQGYLSSIEGTTAAGTINSTASTTVCGTSEDEHSTFLYDLSETYQPLFEGASFKTAYNQYWSDYAAAVVGKNASERPNAVDLMKASIGASWDSKGGESKSFCCAFTNGIATLDFNGSVITGYNASGGVVFSHAYKYLQDGHLYGPAQDGSNQQIAYMDMTIYESLDGNKDEFKYFAMCGDTPDTTYHIEFRYGSSLEDLEQMYSGSYAYWLAAGIPTGAVSGQSKVMMSNVIALFCAENLASMTTEETKTQRAPLVGTWIPADPSAASLVLAEDGTVNGGKDNVFYAYDGKLITVVDDVCTGYTYMLSQDRNTLTLSDADGKQIGSYTKWDGYYNISIRKNITGGSVSVRDSAVKAKPGETVTFTVNPTETYTATSVGYWTVARDGKEGKLVALKANKDGSYSFTMPDSSVVIGAAFQTTPFISGGSSSSSGRVGGTKETDWYLYASNEKAYLPTQNAQPTARLFVDQRILNQSDTTLTLETREYTDAGYKVVDTQTYTHDQLVQLFQGENAVEGTTTYNKQSVSYKRLNNVAFPKVQSLTAGNKVYLVAKIGRDAWVDAKGEAVYRWTSTEDSTVTEEVSNAPQPIVWLYNLTENSHRGSIVREILKNLNIQIGTIDGSKLDENIGYLVGWDGYESTHPAYNTNSYDVEYILMGNLTETQMDDFLAGMSAQNIRVNLKSVPTAWTAGKTFSELFAIMAKEDEAFKAILALDSMIYDAEQLDKQTYSKKEGWSNFQKALADANAILQGEEEREAKEYLAACEKLKQAYLTVTGKTALTGELALSLSKQEDGKYQISAALENGPKGAQFSYVWQNDSTGQTLDNWSADALRQVKLTITGTGNFYGTLSATLSVPSDPVYRTSASTSSITVEVDAVPKTRNMPAVTNYVVQLYQGETLVAKKNSAQAGSFTFSDLSRNTSYTVKLYAENPVGRGNVLTADVTTRSGGSSSSGTTYAVTTPSNTANGTVTVSPKNASKGSSVTITVKPDSGYALDQLKVKDRSGKQITLTDKGNGQFTFTMPASKVTVEASFAKTEQPGKTGFTDVSASAYYADAVAWAVSQGITTGTSATTFSPDASCTRGQIVTFLWRAAGSPSPKGTSSFADVPAESYYAQAVAWAVENGITNGTGEGTFSPDTPCDRSQSVTFLFRALGGKTAGDAAFSDVPAGSYYASAVAWAAEQGITTGTSSTTFSPNDTCTRGQIVTFLYRGYQGK